MQKHLFNLDPSVRYLNCAYMSPMLKSVEEKGIAGIRRKRNPFEVAPIDFFTEGEEVRASFAKMANCRASQVALIPSASYGLSTAIKNVPGTKGKHAVTIKEEFPSGVFPLRRWCKEHATELKVIESGMPEGSEGEAWNRKILEAIGPDTAMVLLSSIHWMNGLRFDLEKIGERCQEVGAVFIVDATQSFGAMPIDVKAANIDVLVCACYKWMMGPYSCGLAYFSEAFNEGVPLEETWMNRSNAVNFRGLTEYDEQYKPDAGRYNVGESGNFILLPMVHEALRQLNEWRIDEIQAYCGTLTKPLIEYCQQIGCPIEKEAYRVSHLVGLNLPAELDLPSLLENLKHNKIIVSVRGNTIRVAPNVYNTEEDIQALMDTISQSLPG